jgi:flagellar secretion chaperone FliS
MSNNPALSYQQASAGGATPIGQVILLFDTILRDLGRAVAALRAGKVETRISNLNHALTVIAHLENVLDHEQGGEAAKHFERFYSVTRGMIVQANFQATPEALEEIIKLYIGLRQAWYQVDQRESPAGEARLAQAPANNRLTQAVETHAPIPANEEDAPGRNWSA